jgi:hypothetical protein
MSQSLVLDVKGLYTYSSDIAGLPQGTFAIAENVNITRMNVLESRRGFEYFYTSAPSYGVLSFGSSSDRIKRFVFWKDQVFGHYASSFALFDPPDGVLARGTLITPDNATSIKYVSSSNKNLYVTNSTGVLKTDIAANSLFAAGMPKALSLYAYTDGYTTATGTAVAPLKYVSYVYLISRRDENGVYVYSSPSGRYTYQNTSTTLTRNVIVLAELPANLDSSYFLQLYRTKGASTSATGEEYQLVYERFISSSNGTTLTIENITRTAGWVRINCTTNTNLVTGQKVTISCPTNTTLNGTYYITAGLDVSGGNADEFFYQQTGGLSDIVSMSATGSVTSYSDTGANQALLYDVTPDNLLGATIYTAPSQEGILQANNYPPLASDLAEYQNCLFYADVAQKHGLQIELISSEIYAGMTITIGSEVYTGEAYRDYANKKFQLARPRVLISTVARAGTTVTIVCSRVHGLHAGESVIVKTASHSVLDGTFTVASTPNDTTFTYTGGSTSIATQADAGYIEHNNGLTSASVVRQNTMKELINVINLGSSNYYAFSLSEDDATYPGRVYIEARTFAVAQFGVVSSVPTLFQPELVNPAGPENTSDNQAFKNGLMYSKPQEPEHVPALNIFYVGNADKAIKRIISIRDVLFIFKEEGVFIMRGETEANFTINQLDLNQKIFAPDSIATVNNNIYGLFQSGICEVTDTGINVISFPIRDQLLDIYGTYPDNVKAIAFGIGNDTEGKYILSFPQNTTDAYCSKQIVFDVFSRQYCGNWFQTITAGGVNPADYKIYLGPNENKIRKELRTFLPQDFADEFQTITITAKSDLSLTLSTAANISVNDVLKQGSIYAYVTSVDETNSTCTVDTIESWTTGTADVIHWKAIPIKVEWNSEFAGNPAGLKHYYEMVLLQKSAFYNTATFYFKNDINQAESSIPVSANGSTGIFGDFAWGDAPFGGDIFNVPVRLGIPRTHARCSQLRIRFEHSVAYSDFQITGLSLSFNPTSTRVVR